LNTTSDHRAGGAQAIGPLMWRIVSHIDLAFLRDEKAITDPKAFSDSA